MQAALKTTEEGEEIQEVTANLAAANEMTVDAAVAAVF